VKRSENPGKRSPNIPSSRRADRSTPPALPLSFTIGATQIAATLAYIAGQAEHHKKHDFQAEFIAFLKKNRIEYDPRYIWG
jgi:hypothetical protein